MVDVEKRYFAKPWMMHDNTKMLKHHCCDTHLPRIKQVPEQNITIKNTLTRPVKRHVSALLPSIARSATSVHGTLITTNLETTATYNSTVHEAAQRFILKNNMAKLSPEPSSAHVTHSVYPRRKTLYNHIQAKIDTGLPRPDSKEPQETETHQLKPKRPVNWSALKHELEQDIYIRGYSNRIQFNSNVIYAAQLTTLGNIVRAKIKSHLSSPTGSGDERYKIVVQLTVFPTTTAGLHVASRCLWDKHTDNSITIKMQGVDCDVLIVAFLCYTDIGA